MVTRLPVIAKSDTSAHRITDQIVHTSASSGIGVTLFQMM